MIDETGALASELTRIIDCSYPPSLSELDGLLAHSQVKTIRACIAARSQCAVQKLVSIVYDALPISANTLRILHQICHAAEFRHELLLFKPGLLDALLMKANSSQQDFDDYANTCVLILSRPLPTSIQLPSSAQGFFLRVFQNSTQNPRVETLKPVYHMLSGACSQLFKQLPHDAQQQFDQQLRHILKSSDVGRDAMLLLWCFGIVLLIEYPKGIRSSQLQRLDQITPIPSAKEDWQTASGQKLFLGSANLYRTMTLASLSVIWAIKGGVGVSNEEAIEGIRIASRVVRVIQEDVRENWPQSDSRAKSTFLKLVEKIERLEANTAIFFEAAAFHALIVGKNGLQQTAVAQYELCLTHVISSVPSVHLEASLSESLPLFTDRMQPSTVRAMYSKSLEACVSGSLNHQGCVLTTVMDELATAMCTSEKLRGNAWHALSNSSMQDRLWKFIETRQEHQSTACATYAELQHRRLWSATIASLLTAATTTQGGSPALSHSLVVALVNKQRELNFEGRPCLHLAPPTHRSHISLFQQACTPYTSQHLEDWRDRLNSELESQNHYHRDVIIRSVAHICRDLETRCATAEEPLRREQDKTRALEEQIVGLSKQVSELQSQVSDDQLHLQGLDDEKEFLEQEKRKMHDENKNLTAKLESLMAESRTAQEAAEKALKETKEAHAAQTLVLQTVTLERERENHAHTAQLHELNSTISHMEELKGEKEESYRVLKEQYIQLQHRLSDAEQQGHDERATISRLTSELTHLQARSSDMENQIQGAEAELDLAAAKLSDLQVSHQELKASSEEALQKARMEHQTDMEAAAARAMGERNDLRAQLQTTQQETLRLQNNHEETLRDYQLLQSSMSSLEIHTQELTDLCADQEQELDELRTLRRNVLASMGMGTQTPLAIRSVSRLQEGHANPQTPRRPPHQHKPSALPARNPAQKVSPSTPGVTEIAVDTMGGTASTASDQLASQDGDRLPKRPKARPLFKIPAMQTPFTQKPTLNAKLLSRRLSPTKRSALRQISPNRRHTTVGFMATAKSDEDQAGNDGGRVARRGSLDEIEQADFDMEDEFEAGTPLTPGNFLAGTGRVPRDDETASEL